MAFFWGDSGPYLWQGGIASLVVITARQGAGATQAMRRVVSVP